MFIASRHPAPAGTLLKLECEGEHHAMRGVARVVWLRHADGPEGPAGMGVKFVRLEAGAREAIRVWVEAEARSTADEPSASSVSSAPSQPPTSDAPIGAPEPSRVEARADYREVDRPSIIVHEDLYATNEASERRSEPAVARYDVITSPPLVERPLLPAEEDSPRSRPPRSRSVDVALIAASVLIVVFFVAVLQTEWFDRVGSDDGFEQGKPASTETFGKTLSSALGSLHTSAHGDRDTQSPTLAAAPKAQPPSAHAPSTADVTPVPPLTAAPEAEPAPEPATVTPVASDTTPTPAPPSALALPSAPAAEPTSTAPAAPAAQAGPVQVAEAERGSRVLEIITKPKGATVTIEDQTIIAPGRITLDSMPERVRVTSTLEGYLPASSWVDRSGFVVEYGRKIRRVFHTLKPDPNAAHASPVTPEAARAPSPNPAPASQEIAPAEPERAVVRAPEPEPEPEAKREPMPEAKPEAPSASDPTPP